MQIMNRQQSGSCQMCGQHCYYEIPVTLLDIWRMADHLQISTEKVFKLYPELVSWDSEIPGTSIMAGTVFGEPSELRKNTYIRNEPESGVADHNSDPCPNDQISRPLGAFQLCF